ncbi:MAG: hypothetical protein ACPGQL_09360 [Thermoplasmatota archaeon]
MNPDVDDSIRADSTVAIRTATYLSYAHGEAATTFLELATKAEQGDGGLASRPFVLACVVHSVAWLESKWAEFKEDATRQIRGESLRASTFDESVAHLLANPVIEPGSANKGLPKLLKQIRSFRGALSETLFHKEWVEEIDYGLKISIFARNSILHWTSDIVEGPTSYEEYPRDQRGGDAVWNEVYRIVGDHPCLEAPGTSMPDQVLHSGLARFVYDVVKRVVSILETLPLESD